MSPCAGLSRGGRAFCWMIVPVMEARPSPPLLSARAPAPGGTCCQAVCCPWGREVGGEVMRGGDHLGLGSYSCFSPGAVLTVIVLTQICEGLSFAQTCLFMPHVS